MRTTLIWLRMRFEGRVGKQFYITGRALLRMALPDLVRYDEDKDTIRMTELKFKPAVTPRLFWLGVATGR